MSNRFDVYLTPIFLQSLPLFGELAPHVDGLYNANQIDWIKESAADINRKIKQVKLNASNTNFQSALLLKTSQFLFTRSQKILTPYRTRASNIGYGFPFLSSFYSSTEHVKLVRSLEEAMQDGIFKKTIVDKVNLCKDCDSSYLNFREVCPNCNSLDLTAESIIHHFRCAHVAPESDFRQQYDLVCPKCDKELRHIGIDYDKPSEIVLCQVCSHHTQGPLMEASCVDCGSTMGLERINSLDINRYELTAEGERVALLPYYEQLDKEEDLPEGLLHPGLFNLLVEQEARRIQIKKYTSFLVNLRLKTEHLSFIAANEQIILAKECAVIVKKYCSPLDSVTFTKEASIWILLSEKNTAEAEDLAKLVLNNLQQLLQHNLNSELELLTMEIFPVTMPLPKFT